MSEKQELKFSKYDLHFLIRLKLREFKNQEIENIDEDLIKSYLFDYKWKKKRTIPMCELIDDIMSLEFSDLFNYLSVKAVVEAHDMELNSFKDLISK